MINKISTMYDNLCNQLLVHGEDVGNTKELTNVIINFGHLEDNIIRNREISYEYILGELIWYFSGDNSTKFIGQFGSMWNRLTDDGKTNNSAYGYIAMKKHGFDQIKKMVEILKDDPLSRRAVLNINVPNENVIETKDEPCTIFLQFLIRDGRLNTTAGMRSNDIWFGLPYDIIFFNEVQKQIARELNIEPGSISLFDTSLHAYEKDLKSISNLKPDKINYKLNGEKLIQDAKELQKIVTKENIIEVCLKGGYIDEY